MPSRLHEILLQLFRNRPELAPKLLREALHVTLPTYSEARIESADLTDVQPTEYRADLVVLLEAARNSLQAMDPTNYEFQSEFAKRYLARGRDEGRVEGEAALLSKQLTLKFGPLANATAERLRSASIAELEGWAERILTASSLEDVFR